MEKYDLCSTQLSPLPRLPSTPSRRAGRQKTAIRAEFSSEILRQLLPYPLLLPLHSTPPTWIWSLHGYTWVTRFRCPALRFLTWQPEIRIAATARAETSAPSAELWTSKAPGNVDGGGRGGCKVLRSRLLLKQRFYDSNKKRRGRRGKERNVVLARSGGSQSNNLFWTGRS